MNYNVSMHNLFADRTKFKIVSEDPTNSRIVTLQNFIRKLRDRGEISETDFQVMYPKNAKIGRAHGTAKIHKEFQRIPPLRPIIDTIGSTHYGVGRFISNLLNPLTLNSYNLKDSFVAADRIKGIPQNLFDEGYQFVSFDAKVPLYKRSVA